MVISVSRIASLSALAVYFVGTRADENVEPLVQELCEFRDSNSKALDEWQDLPSEGPVRLPRWHVYETSPDLWPSRADLISWQQSPPLFPYSKKRQRDRADELHGFSMVGTCTLSKAGSANC